MSISENHPSAIILTERGLTIVGTRITLYDLMDYVLAEYPSDFIQGLFELTDEQIDAALTYIKTNRTKVEAEYQKVIQENEKLRLYYEEQNRERIARISTLAPPPGLEAALEKLQASKTSHQLQS